MAMLFDDIFDITGAFGAYQVYMVVLCGSLCLWSVELISQIFIVGKMGHWCSVPALYEYGHDMEKNIAIPKDKDGEYEECLQFDYDYFNFTIAELKAWNRTAMATTNTRTCDYGWNYNTTFYDSTIVSRFDLVCGDKLKVPLLSTIMVFGIFIGAIACGPVSDWFGRKKMIIGFLALKVASLAVSAFADRFIIFAISRFALGIGNSGVYIGAFILAIEVIGPRHRGTIGVLQGLLFGVGTMIISVLAYFFRHDYHMNLVMLTPNTLFLTYFVLLNESPRWLVLKKEYAAARRIIGQMASANNKELPPDFDVFKIAIPREGKSGSFLPMLIIPVLRNRTLIICYVWFVVSLIYYALTLNTAELSGSVHVNTFLSGAIELPANLACMVMVNWEVTGRRGTTAGSSIAAGMVCLLCVPLIMLENDTLVRMLAILGKGFITACFNAAYIYATELFPTEVRSMGLSVTSMSARIGAMIAPFVGAPLMEVWKPLPYVIFGLLATLAGFLTLYLPETHNRNLCDTISEAAVYTGKVGLNADRRPTWNDIETNAHRVQPEVIVSYPSEMLFDTARPEELTYDPVVSEMADEAESSESDRALVEVVE